MLDPKKKMKEMGQKAEDVKDTVEEKVKRSTGSKNKKS